jgi:hypothetical protein
VSGQLEVTTVRTAVAGLVASGLAFLGAYIGQPGAVATTAAEIRDLHDADGA